MESSRCKANQKCFYKCLLFKSRILKSPHINYKVRKKLLTCSSILNPAGNVALKLKDAERSWYLQVVVKGFAGPARLKLKAAGKETNLIRRCPWYQPALPWRTRALPLLLPHHKSNILCISAATSTYFLVYLFLCLQSVKLEHAVHFPTPAMSKKNKKSPNPCTSSTNWTLTCRDWEK